MVNESQPRIAYIAAPGAGLGFSMSGIAVIECQTGEELTTQLKEIKKKGSFDIVFVDEVLAAEVAGEVDKINQETLPAVVLLPNPANPKKLAAESMKRLVTQAVGSDILNK